MTPGHPERPERLAAIDDRLIASRREAVVQRYEAPLATREQLLRVHDAEYVDALERIAPESGLVELDPDTAMNPHTLRAALRAAGAGVLATDLVMAGQADAAFCAVRPPGHHAERARAMGFCFFNNVAVAAAHARAAHGADRVLVFDWDVHHGNGTQDIFYGSAHVLFISAHQWPLYPGTGRGAELGRGEGEGHTVNLPVPPGTGDAGYVSLAEHVVAPLIAAY